MHIKTFKQLSIYKRRHYPFSMKRVEHLINVTHHSDIILTKAD